MSQVDANNCLPYNEIVFFSHFITFKQSKSIDEMILNNFANFTLAKDIVKFHNLNYVFLCIYYATR